MCLKGSNYVLKNIGYSRFSSQHNWMACVTIYLRKNIHVNSKNYVKNGFRNKPALLILSQ